MAFSFRCLVWIMRVWPCRLDGCCFLATFSLICFCLLWWFRKNKDFTFSSWICTQMSPAQRPIKGIGGGIKLRCDACDANAIWRKSDWLIWGQPSQHVYLFLPLLQFRLLFFAPLLSTALPIFCWCLLALLPPNPLSSLQHLLFLMFLLSFITILPVFLPWRSQIRGPDPEAVRGGGNQRLPQSHFHSCQ